MTPKKASPQAKKASPQAPPKKLTAKELVVQQKNALASVKMILKDPIVTGKQERIYKKARKVVALAKRRIMQQLSLVEEMKMMSDRVTERNAKQAAGMAAKSGMYGFSAAQAIEKAAKGARGA